MTSPNVRLVNVVPHTKIKKELTDSEDEDSVACKICLKSFATETALNNHARMEHTSVYLNGDAEQWTSARQPIRPYSRSLKHEVSEEDIKIKTEELISQMEPTSLATLANKNVSYIIIKGGNEAIEAAKAKESKSKPERPPPSKRKELEVQPITGPFECLEPSAAVAEGQCHQIFFSCCDYSLHYRDEHSRRRKTNRCQVCEKPLDGDELKAPYPCEICSMGFETSRALSKHLSTEHTNMKPFACYMCDKRFTQQGGLQQHLRAHTGERPYSCSFCEKRFTQKSGLDQHMRVHTKVKPFRCIVCSKSFCQSVHLKQHMRTHTNVAPFQCGICNKRFKQSSHLNYHLRYHNTSNMTPQKRDQYERLIKIINKQQDENSSEKTRTFVVMSNKDGEEVTMEVAMSDDGVLEQIELEEGEVPEVVLVEDEDGEKPLEQEQEEVEEVTESVVVERCTEDGEVWGYIDETEDNVGTAR